jgi:hypothetical protein
VPLIRHLITHHSNHDLATLTVYTENRTLDESADEIVRHYLARQAA